MEWGCDVEIGVGLDRGLGLTWDQTASWLGMRRGSATRALGPTPASTASRCTSARSGRSRARTSCRGLGPASVIPVGYWTAPALASCAATVGEISGGKFVLGIGSGAIHNRPSARRSALPDLGPIGAMREYLTTVRALLAGETVTHAGKAITLNGVSLGFTPPRVPVALGALGKMLRLKRAASDGAALNWCDAERVAAYRAIVAEGARSAGRDPSEVAIIEYIRICVDDDEDAARRRYVKALMGYAMARPGVSKELGYRGHFARMGFDEQLTDLEARRDRGAPETELIDAFPVDLAQQVGYFEAGLGAAAAFRRLAEGWTSPSSASSPPAPAWSRSRPSWRRASRPASLLTCPRGRPSMRLHSVDSTRAEVKMTDDHSGRLTLGALTSLVDDGLLDTVLASIPDMYGRLMMGKRFTAFFLNEVAAHGMEACDYLLGCDVEMEPQPRVPPDLLGGGYGDFVAVPTSRRSAGPLAPEDRPVALRPEDPARRDRRGGATPDPPAPGRARPRPRLRAVHRVGAGAYLFKESYTSARGKHHHDLALDGAFSQDTTSSKPPRQWLIRQIRQGMDAAGITVECSKGEWAPASTRSTCVSPPPSRWPTATSSTRTARRRSPPSTTSRSPSWRSGRASRPARHATSTPASARPTARIGPSSGNRARIRSTPRRSCPVHRGPACAGPRLRLLLRPDDQLVQAVPGRHLRAVIAWAATTDLRLPPSRQHAEQPAPGEPHPGADVNPYLTFAATIAAWPPMASSRGSIPRRSSAMPTRPRICRASAAYARRPPAWSRARPPAPRSATWWWSTT